MKKTMEKIWLANASKEDAKKILRTWSVLIDIGLPRPVTLVDEDLVGIYGDPKIIKGMSNES